MYAVAVDHVAVAGKGPLGWFLIDGDRVHWSSYGEVHHPAVVLKLLITRFDEAGVEIDDNHRTNVLRLKFRPDTDLCHGVHTGCRPLRLGSIR